MKHLLIFCMLMMCLCLATRLLAQTHPEDDLPPNITKITGFGERPDWSHDNKKIVFVGKVFGDVYEYDVETGFIRCLTLHYKHYGYTRAMYLPNGDILLSGPIEQYDMADKDARTLARHECWLSVLDKNLQTPPVPLGVKCSEGPAVSRSRLKIAWAELWRQNPQRLKEGESVIMVSDIIYEQGKPRLSGQRVAFDSRQMPFSMHSLETQNFVAPNDEQITMAVYRINGGNNTDTYLLNLKTGAYQAMTNSPDRYDEPEGIFPDGKFTTVESAPSQHSPWPLIDIHKLPLDGSGKLERLTFFTNYKGYKASQSVVSDDGRMMCFQIGQASDEAGAGYGLFLYKFP